MDNNANPKLIKYLEELNDGRGHLTPNRFKKSDNHPDYRGYYKLDGKIYQVAGWAKTKEDGSKLMSLSIELSKTQLNQASAPAPAPVADDLPF
jgi:uncharacterized protein (DUF736 family)